MTDSARRDYEALLAHWDRAFAAFRQTPEEHGEDGWQAMAPSEKLLSAARSLGGCRNVLDYGCGSGWAGIAAAKSGCPRVTCADPAPHAAETAERYAKIFGVADRVRAVPITHAWLAEQPAGEWDGFVCSNVLDVVPPEMAEDILSQAARVLRPASPVVIGLNFYMSPEAAEKRGISLVEGTRPYMDGVLRLVSRPDEKWREIFERYFDFVRLDHFAWPGEQTESRRLFFLQATQ